jgi:hypothetical protein
MGVRPLGAPDVREAEVMSPRAAPRITQLTAITFALFPETLDTLSAQRDAFVDDLLRAEVLVRKNLVQETQTFSEDEANKIANYIL